MAMTASEYEDFEAWRIPVSSIGPVGQVVAKTVDEHQRVALARSLDVLALDSLDVEARIVPLAKGRYRLLGRLRATVTQACIVSLEPVVATINEPIDIGFWPPDQITSPAETERGILDSEEPEPIESGRLPVGRLLAECLAACLDPYPRHPDAALERSESPARGEDSAGGPFAALAALKEKSSKSR